VLAAAKAIARTGVSRLTMSALSAALDVTPMAIYRHFADKEALLGALLDDALSGVVVPTEETTSWGDRLRQLHRSVVAALNEYPGLSQLIGQVPAGPHSARLLEGYLEVLLASGIDARQAVLAYTAIYYLAIGGIANETARNAPPVREATSPVAWRSSVYSSPFLDGLRDTATGITQVDVQSYAIDALIAAIEHRP
jgi:AcrR family transcriptional regulator